MKDSVSKRIRVFYSKDAHQLSQQVIDILSGLDIPIDIDADPETNVTNPNTDISIGIWTEHTRIDPEFHRELGNWYSRANTEVFICRLHGPKVDGPVPGMARGIYNYDGDIALKEWLLREVLQIDEVEFGGPKIENLEAAVRHYRLELRQRLKGEEVLNGIHGVEKKALIDAYVPLSLIGNGGPDIIADTDIVETLFNRSGRRIYITGVPGSGKSTLIRLIAYFMTDSIGKGMGRVPIVLQAKSISELGVRELGERIKYSIKGRVRSAGKRTSDFIVDDEFFPAALATVFIDGMDELDEDERNEVQRLIRTFEIRHAQCSFVVTSRPSAYDRSRWTEYTHYRIRPLSTEQALEYVREHGNPDTASSLRELIKSSESIRELAEVPFMLALMANYARQTVELPKQRAQLISQCVLAVLERRRIRSHDQLTDDELVECLTSVSHRLFRIDATKAHAEVEFLFAIQAFLSSQISGLVVPYQPTDEARAVLEELIENTGLLQRSGKSIEFVHRTVWEFFVARFLVLDKQADLTEFALQKAWEEPIRLATGMIGPEKIEDFIATLWQQNTGLALRALSESPFEPEQIIAENLAKKTENEIADLVRDLKALLIEREGKSGSERVVIDTIKEILPRTKSAEVIWETLAALVHIRDRYEESRGLIMDALSLESVKERYDHIWEQVGFANVPEGVFMMGTDREDRTVNERPAHKVFLSAFQISKITLKNRDVAELPFSVGMPDKSRSPSPDHPVIWVTWFEAQVTAIWFGCRLPTEAEWEYACRSGGTDDEILFSEASIPNFAWFAANANNTTHVGGSLRANTWGIYDMLGNVREWCSDWFQEDLYMTRSDGECRDPIGPHQGLNKVLRGGCFDWNSANLVPTYRNSNLPASRGFQNGIRLVSGLPREIAAYLERHVIQL